MATILPRPEVKTKVEPYDGNRSLVNVEISREGKGRKYTALGNTPAEAVTDVIDMILKDGHTAEWLP